MDFIVTEILRAKLVNTQYHLLLWMVMESVKTLVSCPEHAQSWGDIGLVQKE